MQELIKELTSKKILILGFGKEGRSTYQWLRTFLPEKDLTVADRNETAGVLLKLDRRVKFVHGEHYLDSIRDHDVVFKSPGISLKDVDCEDEEKITSQTDKFLQYFGKQTIGVTGTKGKSTTASLIFHMLKENGKKAVLLGNIGVPALDKLREVDEETIVVYELSAHQLQYVHHSPKVAVLLNIFPEHLDHFASFEAYSTAKFNINRHQGKEDLLIIAGSLKGETANRQPQIKIIEKTEGITGFALKGDHNLLNVDAALKAVEFFGVDKVSALASLKTFEPLPHRLEYVGEFGGVRFYNDSIATVPEATMEAIKAIGVVHTLILGGFDRGLDYAELLCFVRDNDHIENVIFTGKAGEIMYKMITTQPANGKRFFRAGDMGSIFSIIEEHTPAGGVCLLSPAAASYDRYHNFEHRGDMFREFARNFKKTTK
jgi:UDP-N-acetylmuramoylalanine--D-glutamate ligase